VIFTKSVSFFGMFPAISARYKKQIGSASNIAFFIACFYWFT